MLHTLQMLAYRLSWLDDAHMVDAVSGWAGRAVAASSHNLRLAPVVDLNPNSNPSTLTKNPYFKMYTHCSTSSVWSCFCTVLPGRPGSFGDMHSCLQKETARGGVP